MIEYTPIVDEDFTDNPEDMCQHELNQDGGHDEKTCLCYCLDCQGVTDEEDYIPADNPLAPLFAPASYSPESAPSPEDLGPLAFLDDE